MKTLVDISFTLLNRDHFSLNESFATKNAKFTSDAKSNLKFQTFEHFIKQKSSYNFLVTVLLRKLFDLLDFDYARTNQR